MFACAADKDIKDIAKLFVNRFDNVYVTRPGSQKHSDLKLAIESVSQAGINFKADKKTYFSPYTKLMVEDECHRVEAVLIKATFKSHHFEDNKFHLLLFF